MPLKELYDIRIASAKPSLSFFLLLICSAVIDTQIMRYHPTTDVNLAS